MALPPDHAEDFIRRRAGLGPVGGNFLNYYISSIIYPDVSVTLLAILGGSVCVGNLAIYAWRLIRWLRCLQVP